MALALGFVKLVQAGQNYCVQRVWFPADFDFGGIHRIRANAQQVCRLGLQLLVTLRARDVRLVEATERG